MAGYKLTKRALLRQILLAVCSSLGFLATGLIRGFSSPGIPSMKNISPHLLTDLEAATWITSVPPLGAFLGSLVAMPWMHYMGRKRVLQIIGPLFALAWIGIALSQNSTNLLIFFRWCTGFTAGVSVPGAQVYVSECSHPKMRGLLASLPSVIMVGGIVIQFLFGFVLDWRGMAWISAVFPAAMALVLIPFPESPPWLKLNGKEGYVKSCEWYGIRPEYDQDNQDESRQKINPTDNSFKMQTSFLSRGVMMPLSLALAIIIFQQTCGNDVVTFNTVMIFKASGSTMDNFIASLLVGANHFIFIFLSIFLVDKFGRKFLLIFSSLVMGVSIGCLSLYFYLQQIEKSSNLSFLPLLSMMVYIAAFSLGFCTVPLILVGEIFPLAYRSYLSAFTTSIGLLSMFIELKTYSDLVYYLGQAGAFGFYSFMNFFAAVYICFLLPETKGKSLEEIELHFSRKQNSKGTSVLMK